MLKLYFCFKVNVRLGKRWMVSLSTTRLVTLYGNILHVLVWNSNSSLPMTERPNLRHHRRTCHLRRVVRCPLSCWIGWTWSLRRCPRGRSRCRRRLLRRISVSPLFFWLTMGSFHQWRPRIFWIFWSPPPLVTYMIMQLISSDVHFSLTPPLSADVIDGSPLCLQSGVRWLTYSLSEQKRFLELGNFFNCCIADLQTDKEGASIRTI